MALVPSVPPFAVKRTEPGLQIEVEGAEILEGPVDGCLTVTTFVVPPVVAVHGEEVFSIRTQYVVVMDGDTVRVELVAPPIGLVPTTAPVPH